MAMQCRKMESDSVDACLGGERKRREGEEEYELGGIYCSHSFNTFIHAQ